MQRTETFNYLPCIFPPSLEMSTLTRLNSPSHHLNPQLSVQSFAMAWLPTFVTDREHLQDQ